MTLENWLKGGGCMLSGWTEATCCKYANVNGDQLRQMELHNIYQIPNAGEIAEREITRFAKEHLGRVTGRIV